MYATPSLISRMVVLVLAFLLLGFATGAAQVPKVSSDDIMDAALDMKRAAELADKLAPEGAKYCRWGLSPLEASDLDVAISRFLLNHGSKVPDNISASKMWRVSFVAGNMVHQFAMGVAQCGTDIRYSDNARMVSTSAFPVLQRLVQARSKFDQLAYQQTLWQEESTSQNKSDNYNRPLPDTGQVEPSKFQGSARELKEAAEAAAKVTVESAKTKGCLKTGKPPELTYLTKLVDYFEHTPHLPGYVPAGNVWGANGEAIAAQFDIFLTLEACAPYASEKKQARNKATEALRAYHALTAAIAAFDSLALQQTEWEEDNAKKQPAVQEQ